MANPKVGERSREELIAIINEALRARGYDVLQVASASYAIPIVEDSEEGALRIKVEIPKGARDGEGYDPFEEAQNYTFKVEEARKKAQKRAEEKARKLAKKKSE